MLEWNILKNHEVKHKNTRKVWIGV